MDDEFLDWLMKTIINGLGVPLEMVGYNDSEFSRTLSMINGKFVRKVIGKQKLFQKPITKLIQKLYSVCFNTDNPNKDDKINVEKIKITLPSPSTLNRQIASDQLDSVTSIADFITETMVVNQTETSEAEKAIMKQMVRKDLLPNLNWEKYDEMHKLAKQNLTKDTLKSTPEDVSDGY